MAKKTFSSGLVYSTNKDLMKETSEVSGEDLPANKQQLLIKLDAKQRGGKVVTLVDGFEGRGVEALGKQLKNHCGTGGTVKDGRILIQGDNREKIMQWLLKQGFSKSRKG